MINFNNIDALDKKWIQSFARFRTPVFTLFMQGFSYTAIGQTWFLGGAFLLLLHYFGVVFAPEQNILMHAFIYPFIAWMIGQIIKHSVKRRRPSQSLKEFKVLAYSQMSESFPSLHAGSSVALATALTVVGHPWAAYFIFWATIVTFSRFYLGVHYFTDILGGTVLGILSGLLSFYI